MLHNTCNKDKILCNHCGQVHVKLPVEQRSNESFSFELKMDLCRSFYDVVCDLTCIYQVVIHLLVCPSFQMNKFLKIHTNHTPNASLWMHKLLSIMSRIHPLLFFIIIIQKLKFFFLNDKSIIKATKSSSQAQS